MKPLTQEWLDKVEADLRTAVRENEAAEYPNFDAAAFHAQQAAEKYIKAVLCERDARIPRTHDLALLIELLEPSDAALVSMRAELDVLSQFAVHARYPRFLTTDAHALRAIEIARRVRAQCTALLEAVW